MVNLYSYIRAVPNWPKEGVTFRDITPLLESPPAFSTVCQSLVQRYSSQQIDKVVGIDARGFVFAAVIAYELSCGLVLARKKGKLPEPTIKQAYALEYGSHQMEIQREAIKQQDRLLIIDDVVATGGTLSATINLVTTLGGKVVECACVMELLSLKGRQRLGSSHPLFSLLSD